MKGFFEGFSFSKVKHEEESEQTDVSLQSNTEAASTESASDPTTYSTIAPKLETLQEISEEGSNTKVLVDSEGKRFYQLRQEFAYETQQFISRILKGILNVSDVVMIPDADGQRKFYSVRLPLDQVEKSHTYEEIVADIDLISLLFNDSDRSVGTVPHNMTREGEKVGYYDFGSAYSYFYKKDAVPAWILRDSSKEKLLYLKERVEELKSQYGNSEGKKFLRDILVSVGADSLNKMFLSEKQDANAEDAFDNFYETFMRRVSAVEAYLDSALNAHEVMG